MSSGATYTISAPGWARSPPSASRLPVGSGDGLELDGAACYFWIHGAHTRWHLTGQPLAVSDGGWAAEPNRVTLPDDESQWHHSWSLDPANPAPLSSLLKEQQSYGFSFVGFSREVSGRLSMDELEISRR